MKGAEPATDPLIWKVDEAQVPMLASGPALTAGSGFTTTTTLSEDVQLYLSMDVKVYVMVEAGFAIGLVMVELLNPADGLHE